MPIHCLGGSAGKPSGIDLVLNGFVLRSGASQKPCLQSSTSCPAIRTIQKAFTPLNITVQEKVHCLLGEPHELLSHQKSHDSCPQASEPQNGNTGGSTVKVLVAGLEQITNG